ncbi:hypothetical protein PM082_009871 [Marasmius tenuissimus]|nr:hypothetical protein PM082_009871 [Marasmius tenuissimus]
MTPTTPELFDDTDCSTTESDCSTDDTEHAQERADYCLKKCAKYLTKLRDNRKQVRRQYRGRKARKRATTDFSDDLISNPPLFPSSITSSEQVDGILASIDSLCCLLSSETINIDKKLQEAIRQVWYRVLGWIAILLQTHFIDDSPPYQLDPKELDERREEILEAANDVVMALDDLATGDQNGSFSALKRAPLFIPTVLEACFHHAEVRGVKNAFSVNFLPFIDFPSSREQFDAAIKRLRSRFDISGTLFKAFCNATAKESLVKGEGIEGPLSLMFLVITHGDEWNELVRELLAKGLVPQCTSVMNAIALEIEESRDSLDKEAPAFSVMIIRLILQHTFRYGLTWVNQSLDSGTLFSSLAMVWISHKVEASYPGMELDAASYPELLDGLRPFLIFRSVLKRVSRELRNIRESGLLGILDEETDKELRMSLERIREEAVGFRRSMRKFDAKARREKERYCVNEMCDIKYTRRDHKGRQLEAKCCSRCRVATYCSSACQTTHWNEGGHRDECRTLPRPKSGQSCQPSHLDISFVKYLVRQHLEANLVAVKTEKIIVENLSKRPEGETFLVIFEMLETPMKVSMCSLEDQDEMPDNLQKRFRDERWKDRVRKDQWEALVLVLLPFGPLEDRFSLIYVENLENVGR